MSLVCYGLKKCYDRLTGKTYYKMIYEKEDRHKKLKNFITLLINVFAGIIAACIAWRRNEGEGILAQVFITVLAFFFGALYLIYFVGFVLLDSSLFKKSYLVNMNDAKLNQLAQQAETLLSEST